MTSQSQNMPSSQHTRGYHWQRRHASAQLKGALLALPLGLLLTSNTIAQTNETSAAIDETVIVASRVADLSHQVGVSVSVLDREDILSLGYPDLGSLLDTQPGVTVTMDGGFGKAAAVRIRGEEGFRTRIVLDGINIADPSSPQISPRIEHILGSELTRVEILRGPQGLLWGADAGGVVLMSTIDQAATTGLDASVEIGGNEFGQAAIKGTYAGEQITGTLSVATLESEGINARDSDNTNPDKTAMTIRPCTAQSTFDSQKHGRLRSQELTLRATTSMTVATTPSPLPCSMTATIATSSKRGVQRWLMRRTLIR